MKGFIPGNANFFNRIHLFISACIGEVTVIWNFNQVQYSVQVKMVLRFFRKDFYIRKLLFLTRLKSQMTFRPLKF